MKTLTISLSGLAICAAGASFAGTQDFVPVAPVSVAAPVSAPSWSAGVDLSYGLSARTNTDSDGPIENSPFGGFSIGGYFSTNIGQMDLTIDGRFTQYDFNGETDAYVTGPKGSGALGVHLGKNVGNTFIGGFAAYGIFEGYDGQEDYMGGYMVGAEASKALGNGTGFAQLGYANLIGDPDDNEFVGVIGRVGYGFDISEKIGVVLDVEAGYSFDCFVDCDNQPGMYGIAGVEVEYRFSDTMAAFAGYEFINIYDEDDGDTGTESNIMLGVRMAFGASDDGNLLATPMGAFKAAGWMEPLD